MRLDKRKDIGSQRVIVLFWKSGFDPIYGARPIKRLIQTEILDTLALLLLDKRGEFNEVEADGVGGKVNLETHMRNWF